MRWGLIVVALPLAIYIATVVLTPQPNPHIQRIDTAEISVESLGQFPFDQAHLTPVVRAVATFEAAQWKTVKLPHSIELGADIDLPEDAPKSRVWFRIRVPDELLTTDLAAAGRLGIMSNRIMGGPWAVWVDGVLVQSNLSDWRIGWNVPMRAMLPTPLRAPATVLIGVAYPEAKGFAMGSLYMGPADAIDQAWLERNRWHSGVAIANGAVAFALMLITLQLAVGRRKEPVYALLCANAVYWVASGFQYTHDFTGQENLSMWFGWAVDVSVNWVVVLGFLFAYEMERLAYPRFRVTLVLYACLATFATMPIWAWNKNALIAQHLINAVVFIVSNSLLTWNAIRRPGHSIWLLSIGLWIVLGLGLHDLLYLTNQTHPDNIHAFQFSVVVMFLIFMYVTNRRFLQTLAATERHQVELQEKLVEQEQQLAEQHQALEAFRLENSLRAQRDSIMQDLHDRVGSSLTTVLYRVRGGGVSADETTLLLQELEDELRNISKPTVGDAQTLNEILADLRQRVQRRLDHGAIALAWDVDPYLPETPLTPAVAMHLRALLNEAIANVIKHANATQIRVSAGASDTSVTIEVQDNGRGFDIQKVTNGRGLTGMKYRAAEIGATLEEQTSEGQGCQVKLTIPIAKTE